MECRLSYCLKLHYSVFGKKYETENCKVYKKRGKNIKKSDFESVQYLVLILTQLHDKYSNDKFDLDLGLSPFRKFFKN